MRINKLGLVYNPIDNPNRWMHSHAYIPTPFILNNDIIRVLVSFWDINRVGRLGYIDVDIKNPTKVISVSESPVLNIGNIGDFDSMGITPMSYIKQDNEIILFYTGWSKLDANVPYTLLTGVAISKNYGISFSKLPSNPILKPSTSEPNIRTAAYILKDKDIYKLYYVGGKDWFSHNNKLNPTYNLKIVQSTNITTLNNSKVTTSMKCNLNIGEYAIGRPCVYKENNIYKMFFSSRIINKGYKLAYAESEDGILWNRIPLKWPETNVGWDSDNQCFAYYLKTPYGNYLFYNGNNHGEKGFGVCLVD